MVLRFPSCDTASAFCAKALFTWNRGDFLAYGSLLMSKTVVAKPRKFLAF
jgi:hypothetical protein